MSTQTPRETRHDANNVSDFGANASARIGGPGRKSTSGGAQSDRPGYTSRVRRPLFSRLSTRLTLGVAGLVGVLLIALAVTGAALRTSYVTLQQCIALSRAAREASAIAAAAREQYIHESHAILTRDPVHLGHDRHWAAELADRVERLTPLVGEPERQLLERVHSSSTAMGRTFVDKLFPAAVVGDLDRVRSGHAEVEASLESMLEASDRTVTALATNEEAVVAFAFGRARVAAVTVVVTTLLAMFAAIALAAGLIRGIVRPLSALSLAAAKIGQGDFTATAPPTGAAEFEELRAGLGRMALELQEREGKLLKAERLAGLGALAAGVAHELNNPLGVILGYAKTLRRSGLKTETANDLQIIEDEAHQCQRIVEDLVAFAREPRLERSVVDLPLVLRDVVARLERSGELSERAVHFVGAEHAELSVDATRIGQVIRNLLLNAVASTAKGGTIEVAVELLPKDVVVKIRDSGVGIAREDLPHLFEPFFSKRAGGTGLGLAVSHGIVMAHGGSIEIHSESGQGTTVTVQLPKGTTERQ